MPKTFPGTASIRATQWYTCACSYGRDHEESPQKLGNAIMKRRLRMVAIHQTATSLQRTDNLNPRTRWYPTVDKSNQMKSAHFTIHPGKNAPPQNGCQLKSVSLKKKNFKHQLHILHFPNSTGRHYTKYRFSPDIESPADTINQWENVLAWWFHRQREREISY